MPYQLAPEELATLVGDQPRYRTDQLRSWLYDTPVLSPEQMTNLPGDVRERLGESHWPFSVEAELEADAGATRKWLFRAPDGASIETVVRQLSLTILLFDRDPRAILALRSIHSATKLFFYDKNRMLLL